MRNKTIENRGPSPTKIKYVEASGHYMIVELDTPYEVALNGKSIDKYGTVIESNSDYFMHKVGRRDSWNVEVFERVYEE